MALLFKSLDCALNAFFNGCYNLMWIMFVPPVSCQLVLSTVFEALGICPTLAVGRIV